MQIELIRELMEGSIMAQAAGYNNDKTMAFWLKNISATYKLHAKGLKALIFACAKTSINKKYIRYFKKTWYLTFFLGFTKLLAVMSIQAPL